MSHKIITIARQFGSGGHEAAQRLSDQLGIPLYDRKDVYKRQPVTSIRSSPVLSLPML